MKKLLFFLAVIVIATSCKIDLKDSRVDNPEGKTTVQIQNNIIDSCAILAADDNYIYVLDSNTKLIKYKLKPINYDYVIIHSGLLIFFILLFLITLIFIIIRDIS